MMLLLLLLARSADAFGFGGSRMGSRPASFGLAKRTALRALPEPQDESKTAREQRARDAMSKIKTLRKQGRRYDGNKLEEEEQVEDEDVAERRRVEVEEEDDDDDDVKRRDFDPELAAILKLTSRTERLAALAERDARNTTSPEEDELREEAELVAAIAKRIREKRKVEEQEVEEQEVEEQRREKFIAAKAPPPPAPSEKQQTTGIGGSWKPDDEASVEMYVPKVGSWGAFPRPKDISKAYGGGKRVGVGVPGYEESLLTRESKLDAETTAYIAGLKREAQVAKDNEAAIEAGIERGRRLFSAGKYKDAVVALENVTVAFCTVRTRIGAKALLELAMAKDGAGNVTGAVELYTELAKCPHFDIAKNAQMLSYRVKAEREVRASGFLSFDSNLAAEFANRKTYTELLESPSARRRDKWLRRRPSKPTVARRESSSFDDIGAFEVTDTVVALFMAIPLLPIAGVAYVILSK